MNTPWGKAQIVEKLTERKATIYNVSTSGHGGYLVPKTLAARMPQFLKVAGFEWGQYLAFEEDCAWSALYLAFPDLALSSDAVTSGCYSYEEMMQEAEKTFNRYYSTNN